MKAKTIPFTQKAFTQMQEKCTQLRELREQAMLRLQTAREMGDLSENGAYKYAKFELGDLGRQIRKLEYLLENGFVPEQNYKLGAVVFESKVTVQASESKKESTFTLVSEHESNPSLHKLSYKSPLGAAVFGRKSGDTVYVLTPKGRVQYMVVAVE